MQTDWFLLGILVQTRCAVLFIPKGCESTLPDLALGIVPYWLMSMLLLDVAGGRCSFPWWAGSLLGQSDAGN